MNSNSYTVVSRSGTGLSLQAVKQMLRIDFDAEDAYIEGLISSAQAYCENHTGVFFTPAVVVETLPGWPCDRVILLRFPVPSVLTVGYEDENGDAQTLSETEYRVLATAIPAGVFIKSGVTLPDLDADRPDAVRVQYQTGTDGIPDAVRQAMLLMIAFWYENREDGDTVKVGSVRAVHDLLNPYQRVQC